MTIFTLSCIYCEHITAMKHLYFFDTYNPHKSCICISIEVFVSQVTQQEKMSASGMSDILVHSHTFTRHSELTIHVEMLIIVANG